MIVGMTRGRPSFLRPTPGYVDGTRSGFRVEPLHYLSLYYKNHRAEGEVFRDVSRGRPHVEAQNPSA